MIFRRLTKRSDESQGTSTKLQICGRAGPERFLNQIYSKDLFCVAGKIFL